MQTPLRKQLWVLTTKKGALKIVHMTKKWEWEAVTMLIRYLAQKITFIFSTFSLFKTEEENPSQIIVIIFGQIQVSKKV